MTIDIVVLQYQYSMQNLRSLKHKAAEECIIGVVLSVLGLSFLTHSRLFEESKIGVHRTEIKRNYRSSLDFRGGEGIILLEEKGYCSLMVVRPNPVQE